MKTYRKLFFLLLAFAGVLFSGCGQINSPAVDPETPSVQLPQVTTANTDVPAQLSHPAKCKKIAFVNAKKDNPEIFSSCPDGSNLIQLTNSPGLDTMPAWSPDGKSIAFVSARSGNNQIYTMDEDGSHLTQFTSDNENDFPVWLPNGEQIAFRSTDGKGLFWWQIVSIETRQIVQISEPSYDFFFQTLAWSPDGQKIAYMSLMEQQQRNDGASQIHVKNVDGSNDVALTSNTWANIHPVWSPDGEKIAFFSERDGKYNMFALYVMSKDGKDVQKLSDPVYSENATLTWFPDGQKIAVSDDATMGKIVIFNVSDGSQSVLPNVEKASFPAWQP